MLKFMTSKLLVSNKIKQDSSEGTKRGINIKYVINMKCPVLTNNPEGRARVFNPVVGGSNPSLAAIAVVV